MVFKKSFTLLVATATTPFFAFVSVMFEQDCSLGSYSTNYLELFQREEQVYDSFPRYQLLLLFFIIIIKHIQVYSTLFPGLLNYSFDAEVKIPVHKAASLFK